MKSYKSDRKLKRIHRNVLSGQIMKKFMILQVLQSFSIQASVNKQGMDITDSISFT